MKSKYMVAASVLMVVLAVSLIVVYTFRDTLFQETKNTSDVIMSLSPTNAGTITPEKGVYYDIYQKNTDLTLTATAESGYTFAYLEISTVTEVLTRPTQSTYVLKLTEDEYIIIAFFTKNVSS